MLRRCISADPAVLDALHARHDWIPDSSCVRPSDEMKRLQTAAMSGSEDILRDVFGGEALDDPLFRVCDQPFPYQVPDGTVHLVAWFSKGWWTDAEIARRIAEAIDARGGGDFVYYTNPKKSVVHDRFDHVQLFWRPQLSSRECQK